MEMETLRLECLKIVIDSGEALDNAPHAAQRILSFVLGLNTPKISDGLQTLNVGVEQVLSI